MPRTFSIVTPVYDPPADVLREAIDSVVSQSHPWWELVLVDDASPSPHVARVLAEAAASDERIVVLHRPVNGGIVAASNDGLAAATGDFVGLLDHDDVLVTDALAMVDRYADANPAMDYCYSDEDLLDPDGNCVAPFYKPDWSPERLRSQNYCGHFSVFRADLLERIGGFRDGFDGSQDYDLFLRATEAADQVVHIPFVLYHWRQIATSVASGDTSVKPYAYTAGRRAVQEHCERVGIDAEVEIAEDLGNYHLRRRVHTTAATSVVVTTRGEAATVWGVRRHHVVEAVASVARSTSRPIEFVVVHDDSTSATVIEAARRAARGAPFTAITSEDSSDPAMCNLGSIHATGEFLLLLDEAVELSTIEFLDPLLAIAEDPSVGAVGPRLSLSDGRVGEAGHVFHGRPCSIMWGRSATEVGPGGILVVQREVSGLSSACLLVRRSAFHDVGGMSSGFASPAADVDLGLKLRHRGLTQIWTPQVRGYHHRSADLGALDGDELAALTRRWGDQLRFDPLSNPNLEPGRGDWVERGLR